MKKNLFRQFFFSCLRSSKAKKMTVFLRVSNKGRVQARLFSRGGITKFGYKYRPVPAKSGYASVYIRRSKGKYNIFLVHRVMCVTFRDAVKISVPNFQWKDFHKYDVDHLEGKVNVLERLEVVLHKENTRRMIAKGRRKRGAPEEEREGEVWKEFRDTGWQVSDQGRTRNTRGKIRTPRPQEDGYCRVGIDNKHIRVHHAVAEAFGIPTTSREGDQSPEREPVGQQAFQLGVGVACENMQHSFATNLARKSGKKSKPSRGVLRSRERRVDAVPQRARGGAHAEAECPKHLCLLQQQA